MTLKTKLLALLWVLAIGPLLAIGVIGYVQSIAAVRAQLESQTRPLAERAAESLRKRAEVIQSDLLLLAGNEETRRLLESAAVGAVANPVFDSTAAAARAFFASAWNLFRPFYASIQLEDSHGRTLIDLGDPGAAALANASDTDYDGSRLVEVKVPALASDEDGLGMVRAFVRVDALLQAEGLPGRFGRGGVSLVRERGSGRVLYAADANGQSTSSLHDLGFDALRPALGTGARVAIQAGNRRLIGWTSSIGIPPLDVISLAEVAEFEAPFRAQRRSLFLIVLALAAAVVPAGAVLLRRATRSLDELTLAADLVGSGDFAPDLPSAGPDEVGRLAAAFEAMVAEVRRMMIELERSRQLAAVGTFAAELSHEIRNPLTAVKLNLQRLERLVVSSDVGDRAERPIQIALSEIARLDRVVRSALRLGRPDLPLELHQIDMDDVVTRALGIVASELDRAGIDLHTNHVAAPVMADAEQLAGGLVNLLLNALQAMPEGGTLLVRTSVTEGEGRKWADVTVQDTGGGIPESARERLFHPFFTTRSEGTGLGLALALRTAEAHGGTITLVSSSGAGSEFCLRLPLLEA